MLCAHCQRPLGYVHGHAACLFGQCPMFGVNQAECCSGDHGDCPPTATVARVVTSKTPKSSRPRE